jgi:hypothetical protein
VSATTASRSDPPSRTATRALVSTVFARVTTSW